MDNAQAGSEPAKAKAPPQKAPAKTYVLDKTRSFGTIYSATGHHEASFEQDGRHFKADGTRVILPGDKENEARITKELERTRKERVAQKRAEADAIERGEEPEANPAGPGGVNLNLWASGQALYRFAAVREAINTRWHKMCHTEAEAIDFLLEQKVITTSEAKKSRLNARRAR